MLMSRRCLPEAHVMNFMHAFYQEPFNIGSLKLPNRLIQGPLAGFSCAPFRQLYYQYSPPAYCVTEMISANDVLHKHQSNSRFIYRAQEEKILCYQISGQDPEVMAAAAAKLQSLGADLIDLNCGCPKAKIRKKGAGSALLEKPILLTKIVSTVRQAITIPLTVKLRITGDIQNDIILALALEEMGADALIIHGRRWVDDYSTRSDFHSIAQIKKSVRIPVVANGDIADHLTLKKAITMTNCDAYMIARAGCGKPWLYQQLLTEKDQNELINHDERINCFLKHLDYLALLENEQQAVLQSKSLVRYYFGSFLNYERLQAFYTLDSLITIKKFLTPTSSRAE